MKTTLVAATGVLSLALAASVPAQGLADPTRPPETGEPTEAARDATGGRLQSVLLSPGRKIAVIDGTAVPLGGRVGGATLVSIRPAEVVLREGDADHILALYPGVDKKTKGGSRSSGGDRGGKR